MRRNFYYIGHRGCRVNADENTIMAFEKAFKHGADYIEFDVQKPVSPGGRVGSRTDRRFAYNTYY